ncbi:YbhN family protein [Myxosarcina sp. GI1]|uniref:lysylphosphatidylglycerol synthase transmembrane domain-containing protein n=1 Tax=Myxosarcina sp. GI1 TaxID=1541065 RepID=UPI00055EEC4A|nr:YbhN family protein [Myxosarcina sp. GI1]
MKQILSAIKPYLRWFILGGTLFFLVKVFKDRWQEITAVKLVFSDWLLLFAALCVTLLAHIWSGWVWTWILDVFQQSITTWQGIRVYLITNIAKYLPGNIWHFYGRITAITQNGGSLSTATFSVLLEPLLLAAAALSVYLVGMSFGWLSTSFELKIIGLQIACLLIILVGINPRILNFLLLRLSRSKNKLEKIDARLERYPIAPFLGEIGFLAFRGTGFLLTFTAFKFVAIAQIPQLISAFSFAWLLGLVIPGAPGGIGIFEATIIASLDKTQFPTAIVLATVAFFRVISILAEAIAAGVAWLWELMDNYRQ